MEEKRLRTRLWHCHLVAVASFIIAGFLYFAINPSQIGYWTLLASMLLAVVIVIVATGQRWKRIW